MAGGYEIVKDSIDDCFVERMNVSIRSQIELERFGLDALFTRDVLHNNLSEIGLSCDRAKRRKIRRVDPNRIVATRVWIRKCFESASLWSLWKSGLGISKKR